MVNQTIYALVGRFNRLELHAAKSGREVLEAFVKTVETSSAGDLSQLIEEIQALIRYLLPNLPPYSPPINSLNQIMLALESAEKEQVDLKEAQRRILELRDSVPVLQEDHELIASGLISVLPDDTTVFTHTLSETVLGVLLTLHQKGRIKRVFVTESRPNNDGWITASRLANAGVDTHLAIDAGFPEAARKSDVLLSGAEIINVDGSVVCKVGVYPAAMYCRVIAKPVYIVADTKKINPFQNTFFNMTPLSLMEIGVTDAPNGVTATGSYFDITPANLVTGYATQRGLLNVQDIYSIAKNQPVSSWLKSQITNSVALQARKEQKSD